MSALFRFTLIAALLLGLGACEEPQRPENYPMPLVVEGFIEEGGNPVVIVTHALNLTLDSIALEDCLEKWGRVSVFDGNRRYLLSGRVNNGYTPSFIFTNTRLRGVAGHTYRLLIETEYDTVEAEATIGPAPVIERLEAIKAATSDTLFSIRAYLADMPAGVHCKFFTRNLKTEKRYYASFLGTFAAHEYDPAAGRDITRGITYKSHDNKEYSHYFRAGEMVDVKVCSMDEPVYNFWTVYERNVSLSDNIMFSFSENCPSNLRSLSSRGVNPLGYWAAYGVNSRLIVVK